MMSIETTKKIQVKYLLKYKFPIEQLLSQNKTLWITRMYFFFTVKTGKILVKKGNKLCTVTMVF